MIKIVQFYNNNTKFDAPKHYNVQTLYIMHQSSDYGAKQDFVISLRDFETENINLMVTNLLV